MRKINNRKSLILAAGGGKYVPNIVRGGNAIPLGNNFYYIKGRKHSAGGVDIGADPKTGLEVEGEEVMKVTPKEVRVYSSVPFLQGNSPAELVMGGANPDAVFNAQEEFKDRNRINDDGTKYENGGKIYDASKNYERAAKVREWTDALVGLFDPTPISGVLDIINARNNDRSNAEMVLAGLSVLPGARVLSKLTRGLGRLTKNQSIIKEGKKISDVVNRDKTLQKAISSFNQSARDGTLAERMRRREIYTPGGDVDLDRIQGEHIKNYNKAIHYFDRYNKLSDSNWANYENFAAASRGINTTVDAYNIGKESVNLVTDENKTNKKKLGGNGRVTNVDGKQSDRYKNNNNNDINQHFVLRSLNRNNVGNNKTVTDILTKDGTAIRFEEAPYSKVDSLVANSIIGDKSLWNAHHLVKSVRAGLTSNPFKYIYNTVENVTNGVYEELLGNIIGKDKAIDVKFHGNINKKPLGGNLPTNQNDFLDTWNASRLATGRYNNQLGDGRLERQAESRNTAREFRSPIGFAMNYGKRAAIRTSSMSDTDYRKEIAHNAQSMKLRLNTPETGQGVIGGAYHAPTHSSYVNQEEFAKDSTVRTHENAHASRATEQEQVISDILGSSSSSTYLRRPTEVYSRLMQFRQANNLDPNIIYDKDSFRELRKTATDYNLINTFKEDEVIDLLNNVAMRNDPNQLNLNNINLNTVPVYAAKYGTKRKSKMGKVISINGNVRNGLIHTPSHEAFAYGGERKPRFNGRYSKPGLHNLSLLASAIIMPKGTVDKEPEKPRRVGWADLHNRLVTADISQKPLDAKRDNTSVAHVISETEKRTRKFNIGGRAKAKVGSGFRINDKKYNVGDTVNYKGQQYLVTDRNEAIPLPDANNNIIDNDIDIPTTNITTPQLTRNIVNGLTNNASTYKKNGETHYFVEAPAVSVPNSNYDMDALQRMILNIPVVNRLTKNANNDINYLSVLDNLKRPYQEDIAKTRNLDNIQFGINLGSSAVDALMSNIFVNQLHSYIPPTITAPTISNPGDIKLNEEDLKDIPEPILMAAAKLKTRYNANPQLAKIEDEIRRTMRDIDRNTSNSRVGLARKQLTALRGQEAKNQVYAQKENIETELINKDKLNQQEVTARNLARYDQYNQALATQMANRARLRLAADTANIQNRLAVSTANANLKAQTDQFNVGNRINSLIHQAGIDGAKAEARANIVSSLLGNVGSAFDVWNRNKRQAKLDEETLKVLGLRAPNVNKLMLRTLGINK
ncbi:hypothetical protein [uncultured phage cr123_1]|uniref:Uncharacterized protein n=1 Tax=uncultured phage cr123_1 TaxID=2986401 RepID=A0AAE7V299_9CAUD|nr:hypothetical protein M1M44_gp64 [uncultured phage cr123_1]QWM89245.1 hypothetical protein [uncultured phage cr123_1]